jgi:hypothetical protein
MYLLPVELYARHARVLDRVPINTLFAQAVLARMVDGRVYVDDVAHPATFYIVHPCGMSLLFGAADNAPFNTRFLAHALDTARSRSACEWLQAYPFDWDAVLAALFAPHAGIECHRRLNFVFERDAHLWGALTALPDGAHLRRTDAATFDAMQGSVRPSSFWRSAADFAQRGAGFDLFYRDQLACQAFSAVMLGPYMELGMETRDIFRGRGLAFLSCCRLIAECLQRGLEPVWSCRGANVGSMKLAQKLGFRISYDIPYYLLPLGKK